MTTVYNVEHSPVVLALPEGHVSVAPGVSIDVPDEIASDLLAPGRHFTTDAATAAKAGEDWVARLAAESGRVVEIAEPPVQEAAPDEEQPKAASKSKTDKETPQ